MRIAMVSECASPLAALGRTAAGDRNVHVLELSSALAAMGHDVTVWTRRDDPALPDTVPLRPGVVVRHASAGPAEPLPRDELVPHLPAFTDTVKAAWATDRPETVEELGEIVARRVAGGYALYPQGGATALDYGGVVFEDDRPSTLAEALAALEAGLRGWFAEQGIEVNEPS